MSKKTLGIFLVAVIIVGAIGYFTLVKKSPQPQVVQQTTSPAVGTGGGGSDEIYYETGAYLGIGVNTLTENETENDYNYSNIISKKNIVIDGVNGFYYVFTDPSLYEGQLLGAYMYYKGNRYSLSFGYNPSTYPQGETVFANILNSFQKVQTSAPTTQNTNVITIKDKYGWFSVEVPKDWKVMENIGARGVSLSSMSIESPDWKSHMIKDTSK